MPPKTKEYPSHKIAHVTHDGNRNSSRIFNYIWIPHFKSVSPVTSYLSIRQGTGLISPYTYHNQLIHEGDMYNCLSVIGQYKKR